MAPAVSRRWFRSWLAYCSRTYSRCSGGAVRESSPKGLADTRPEVRVPFQGENVGRVHAQVPHDHPVEAVRQVLRALEVTLDALAERHVHRALEAQDPLHHAGVVLPLRLVVPAVARRQVQLPRLQGRTGIEFVGDRHGDDAHALQPVPERVAFPPPGQQEQLQQRRLRTVDAVLGAAVPLGDPDGLPGFERTADVARRPAHAGVLRPAAAPATRHHEATVEPHEVVREGVREEVLAHGDLRGPATGRPQRIVHERRVERDVAMIGDEQVRLAGRQGVQAAPGEPRGRAANQAPEPAPEFDVQVVHRAEFPHAPGKRPCQRPARDPGRMPKAPRQQEARHAPRRRRIRHHPPEHLRDLVVPVGPDVVELFHGRGT